MVQSVTDAGRETVTRLIRHFAETGADAVVLACTDLTLLNLAEREEGLAVLDSTLLHAKAAAEAAIFGISL